MPQSGSSMYVYSNAGCPGNGAQYGCSPDHRRQLIRVGPDGGHFVVYRNCHGREGCRAGPNGAACADHDGDGWVAGDPCWGERGTGSDACSQDGLSVLQCQGNAKCDLWAPGLAEAQCHMTALMSCKPDNKCKQRGSCWDPEYPPAPPPSPPKAACPPNSRAPLTELPCKAPYRQRGRYCWLPCKMDADCCGLGVTCEAGLCNRGDFK
jgi:hypothetical protein